MNLSSKDEKQIWNKNRKPHLNLTLPGIGGVVLKDLDCHDVIGTLLPTLDHLAKCATPQELQYLILWCEWVQHLMLHQLETNLKC